MRVDLDITGQRATWLFVLEIPTSRWSMSTCIAVAFYLGAHQLQSKPQRRIKSREAFQKLSLVSYSLVVSRLNRWNF